MLLENKNSDVQQPHPLPKRCRPILLWFFKESNKILIQMKWSISSQTKTMHYPTKTYPTNPQNHQFWDHLLLRKILVLMNRPQKTLRQHHQSREPSPTRILSMPSHSFPWSSSDMFITYSLIPRTLLSAQRTSTHLTLPFNLLRKRSPHSFCDSSHIFLTTHFLKTISSVLH